MKQAGILLGLALALLAAMALKGALLVLPSPPATESATSFDANRAMARLTRILGDQRPHPVDSDAGDAVRDRLIAEMRNVGLEPRVTDDFVCNGRRGAAVTCARVRNLVATIGPAEGNHLLLSSHYDSTPTGPGASDDGIGVATMLEVAHLLRGQRLTRPITFLFDEGEEAGLLGARAFLEHDPLAARVDIAVNMEARGVTGPAIMFETGRPNGAAIALYGAAVSRPVANSLSTDLYGLIPNSTDVAVFDARPWTILNFAVIGNETRYHSPGDDLAALDRRSVQHMGQQVEQVTRTVAQGAAPAADGTRLYADIAGQVLIVLPLLFGLVLLGLLFLFFAIEAWRRRALLRPLLAMIAALLLSGGLAFAGHFILSLIRAGDYWRAWPIVATTAAYAAALAACVIALLFVAGTAERTKLRAAFWLFLTALGGSICFIAPGAAIYFLLPPLVMALGMVGKRWHPKAEQAGAIIAALLLFVTFGPAIGLFEELMSTGPVWIFAPLGAVMMLPVLIELRPALARLPALFVAAGALDLAIIGWIVAGFTPAYSADRQQLFAVEYVWDATTNSGRFAVNNDGAPVPFAADWQRTELPYSTRKRWVTPAPPVPVVPPGVTVLRRLPFEGGVRLTLGLQANGADQVTLIAPAGAHLRAAGTSAVLQPFGDDGGRTILRCAGRSCDGAMLDVVLPQPQSVRFTLIGSRSGLPPQAAALARARPANARPQYGPDATIVIGQFLFDAAAPPPPVNQVPSQ
ncbi:M20/M25/M40 family metallo-hydrolase [Allosphingosinicella sp.]|uniref:M20/M25/M40 family metallo-hydrolase n=1 Tax=Allosphingosinicella sp. TaxID=2823234 RepID=UPI003783EDE3